MDMVDDHDGFAASAGDEREIPCLITVDHIGKVIFLVEFVNIYKNVPPFFQHA